MKNSKKKRDKDTGRTARESDTRLVADHSDEVKRLNRIVGQVDGIRKMLEGGRDLGEVLIQFKAVHSALKSIELRVFRNYVAFCVEDIASAEKRKEREIKIAELMELYKYV